MNPFLFRPVVAGIWTHRDIVTDTFSFLDLLDAHEILDVREENERRALVFREEQQKTQWTRKY